MPDSRSVGGLRKRWMAREDIRAGRVSAGRFPATNQAVWIAQSRLTL